MKTLLFLLFIMLMLFACSENDRLIYSEDRHDIYYTLVTETRDSMFVSLLAAEDESIATVDISLMGHALTETKKFKVEVVPEMTTAKEGVHYKALPVYYEFPVGEFSYQMPITLLKGDESIKQAIVTLVLRLVPTDEVGIAYEERSVIRIQIGDMLKKPEGKDMTGFEMLFGEYSQTKHKMIIEMTGHDFWDGNYGNYGGKYGIMNESAYYTPYARKLYKMVTETEIRDENGKIIGAWQVP